MKPFDWERLFNEQRVPYIESGANVKRGELAIQCPFCGSADPSKHMGVSLETGWWSCWRNRAQHSGKSPLRLIMRLLGVPYGVARELAGLGEGYIDPEGFDAVAARLMGRGLTGGRAEEIQRRFLQMDADLHDITLKVRTQKFWHYLYDRGFNRRSGDVDTLCQTYGLMAGVTGRWKDRVVVPYVQDGELVTWTARAIVPATLRYLDLSLDESLMAPKDTLFNHDCLIGGGKVLVIVEGPFDALKLDFYARVYGVRAVALSTNSITDSQAWLLQAASTHFERTLIMLDNATTLGLVDSMRMKQSLYFLTNVGITKVPFGAKDAGELTPQEVITWAKAL